MRAISLILITLLLSNCAYPQISKEGSKVKVVQKSTCPAVGQFMSSRVDDYKALNYKSFKKGQDKYAMDLARDRAYKIGGDEIVEVYSISDKPTLSLLAFYSVHKCRK